MNLKEIRTKNNVSQIKLAAAIGVSRSTIAMWETGGSQPDNDNLLLLANYFDVSIDFLLGRKEQKKATKIPVLGKVVAGIPIDAVEEILDYEEITPEMASSGEYFALKIKGNSMEPKISEGDVVIIRKQDNVDNGDTAIILVNGNEATVKKIRKTPDGISLIPNNPSYDITFYSNKEIETLPVRIIGKVVELRAKF